MAFENFPYWRNGKKSHFDQSSCDGKECKHWLRKNRDACKKIRAAICEKCSEWENVLIIDEVTGWEIANKLYRDCMDWANDDPDFSKEEFLEYATINGLIDARGFPVENPKEYLQQQQNLLIEETSKTEDDKSSFIFIGLLILVILLIYIILE